MTASEFLARYPSTVDDRTVLRLNRVSPQEMLSAGRRMKRVVR